MHFFLDCTGFYNINSSMLVRTVSRFCGRSGFSVFAATLPPPRVSTAEDSLTPIEIDMREKLNVLSCNAGKVTDEDIVQLVYTLSKQLDTIQRDTASSMMMHVEQELIRRGVSKFNDAGLSALAIMVCKQVCVCVVMCVYI